MENEKDSVLRKNETDANRIMTMALVMSSVMVLCLWGLLEVRVVFSIEKTPRFSIAIAMSMLLIGAGISYYFKFEKKWLKIMLMSVLIITYMIVDSIITYNASILMVIPVVLSARYFSKRYTIIVSLCTYSGFLLSAIWGSNHGMLDLNNMEMPIGTVIDMGEYTWILDSAVNWPYDKGLILLNTIRYSYAMRFMLAVIVAVCSSRVAGQGRRMVLRQKEMSENKARVGTELALATKIQADMLPSLFPAFPERSEFDIFASMTPAKEVGGDFYDFFMVDHDHLGLVIADVSGKGIPAAMFMMFSKNIIANNAMLGKTPGEVMADANDAICANNSEDMFVTVWFGMLTISTGRLTVVNAGHEYPILMRNGGQFELLKDEHDVPVGWFGGVEYKEYEIQLYKGDRLLVYTDGVPEATNAKGEMFGTDRALRALNRDTGADPKGMVVNLKKGVDEFVGDAKQFDDLTILTLEYKA